MDEPVRMEEVFSFEEVMGRKKRKSKKEREGCQKGRVGKGEEVEEGEGQTKCEEPGGEPFFKDGLGSQATLILAQSIHSLTALTPSQLTPSTFTPELIPPTFIPFSHCLCYSFILHPSIPNFTFIFF